MALGKDVSGDEMSGPSNPSGVTNKRPQQQRTIVSPQSVKKSLMKNIPNPAGTVPTAKQVHRDQVFRPTRAPASNAAKQQSSIDGLLQCNQLLNTKRLSNGAHLEFVSLDLEFSGLTFDDVELNKSTDFHGYFQNLVKGAKNFAVVQLGVCLAGRKPNDHVWHLEPFNIYLFPHRRRLCFVDTTSLTFLSNCGFSFNEWVGNGVDFEALHDIEFEKAYPDDCDNMIRDIHAVEERGAQIILKSIMQLDIPLVLHNGLLDLLHLCDKFLASVGNLESEVQFAERIRHYFPGGIYDTKYIARAGQFSNFPSSASKGFSLEKLSEFLMTDESHKKGISIHGAFAKKYSMGSARLHEAGYDAYLTAQCFIVELQHYLLAPDPMSTFATLIQSYNPIAAMGELAGAMNAISYGQDGCRRCVQNEMCENWKDYCSRNRLVNVLDLYIPPHCFDLVETLNERGGDAALGQKYSTVFKSTGKPNLQKTSDPSKSYNKLSSLTGRIQKFTNVKSAQQCNGGGSERQKL
eukprot:GHVH01008254.1.p1 GENE.GHVH01008254.1~~GHVH01008254.1.p1  ORF type:complete len:519 (-),score=64.01 GHVH01008254.1:88-1644(-)